MGLVKGLIKSAAAAVPAAVLAGKAVNATNKLKRRVDCALHHNNREDYITMKKSTFAVIVTFLAAVAGALAAMFVYIRRREAELDEYEQLLFSDDFSREEENSEAQTSDDLED